MICDTELIGIKACILASLFPFVFMLVNRYKKRLADLSLLIAFITISIILESRAMLVSVCGVFICLKAKDYPILTSYCFFGSLIVPAFF
jgi:hypothetical protein